MSDFNDWPQNSSDGVEAAECLSFPNPVTPDPQYNGQPTYSTFAMTSDLLSEYSSHQHLNEDNMPDDFDQPTRFPYHGSPVTWSQVSSYQPITYQHAISSSVTGFINDPCNYQDWNEISPMEVD
jgi:hypothetical protein